MQKSDFLQIWWGSDLCQFLAWSSTNINCKFSCQDFDLVNNSPNFAAICNNFANFVGGEGEFGQKSVDGVIYAIIHVFIQKTYCYNLLLISCGDLTGHSEKNLP